MQFICKLVIVGARYFLSLLIIRSTAVFAAPNKEIKREGARPEENSTMRVLLR